MTFNRHIVTSKLPRSTIRSRTGDRCANRNMLNGEIQENYWWLWGGPTGLTQTGYTRSGKAAPAERVLFCIAKARVWLQNVCLTCFYGSTHHSQFSGNTFCHSLLPAMGNVAQERSRLLNNNQSRMMESVNTCKRKGLKLDCQLDAYLGA